MHVIHADNEEFFLNERGSSAWIGSTLSPSCMMQTREVHHVVNAVTPRVHGQAPLGAGCGK
jgi:hypothetical protein